MPDTTAGTDGPGPGPRPARVRLALGLALISIAMGLWLASELALPALGLAGGERLAIETPLLGLAGFRPRAPRSWTGLLFEVTRILPLSYAVGWAAAAAALGREALRLCGARGREGPSSLRAVARRASRAGLLLGAACAVLLLGALAYRLAVWRDPMRWYWAP